MSIMYKVTKVTSLPEKPFDVIKGSTSVFKAGLGC